MRWLPIAAVCAGLLGCETAGETARASRRSEQAAALGQLPSAAQRQVQEAKVERGQTFEMIYMILGTPDRVETSADGTDTQWSYRKFYHDVTILGVSLFPGRTQRDDKPRADPMNKLLLGATAQTRGDYARANTRGDYEMPRPPREIPDDGGPELPGADLEVFFQNGQVTDVTVTRDTVLPPSRRATAR